MKMIEHNVSFGCQWEPSDLNSMIKPSFDRKNQRVELQA